MMKTWRYPHTGFWAIHALTIPLIYMLGKRMEHRILDRDEDY